MFNLVSTTRPRSFSDKFLSRWSPSSIFWCLGLFFPRCMTLQLLDCMRFLSVDFSSPSKSLSTQSFISTANFLKIHSAPTSSSLMKMKSNTLMYCNKDVTVIGMSIEKKAKATSFFPFMLVLTKKKQHELVKPSQRRNLLTRAS